MPVDYEAIVRGRIAELDRYIEKMIGANQTRWNDKEYIRGQLLILADKVYGWVPAETDE